MLKKFIKYLDEKLLFNLINIIYRKFLFLKSNQFLKNYPYLKIHKIKNFDDEFSKLSEKFITDKGGTNQSLKKRKFHFYSTYYHEYFKDIRMNFKLVFECGIGSIDETIHSNISGKNRSGASLKVLKNYFPNADIYGADIDKKTLFSEDRIKTYYVNQLNSESIKSMWSKIDKEDFDLIIDDGMHTMDAGYKFFENSFHKLKYGGIYIIEDLHINYIKKLTKKLIKFKPMIVTTNIENNVDDFLLVIKKTKF